MGVELRRVDKDSWYAVCRLAVDDGQEAFVAPNSFSLAQAAYEADTCPMGIYADGRLAGFVMWNYDGRLGGWGMCRLMVDRRYQKKGIGRQAVERLLETVKKEKGKIPFYVSVSRENEVAIRLFRGVGFEDTQKSWGEETLMRIDL